MRSHFERPEKRGTVVNRSSRDRGLASQRCANTARMPSTDFSFFARSSMSDRSWASSLARISARSSLSLKYSITGGRTNTRCATLESLLRRRCRAQFTFMCCCRRRKDRRPSSYFHIPTLGRRTCTGSPYRIRKDEVPFQCFVRRTKCAVQALAKA